MTSAGASRSTEVIMVIIMPKPFGLIGMFGAALLIAPPLLADTLGPSLASASDSATTDAQTSGGFITQQALDQWRASKLVGSAYMAPIKKGWVR
jgi:hypothetical protein